MDCPRKIQPQENSSTKFEKETDRAISEGKDANSSTREKPTKHSSRELDREEAYRLGLMRETWCHVEGKKEQAWCRSTRRHFPKVHNMSTLFNEFKVEEPRCEWKVQEEVNRKERRHFLNTGCSHLTI